jgi:flagellin
LTIATKMLARSEGMKVALSNIGDASNMISVAETGLTKMSDIMIQMRNKAEQAASDTLGSSERAAIATQLSSYAEQIDSMVTETKWNGVQLLNGSVDKRFQTGVDDGEYTAWQLKTTFDPTTMGLSSVVANDAVTPGTYPTNTVASIAATTQFTGLGKLTTGSYSTTITGVAASATKGLVTGTSNFSGSGAVSIIADAANGADIPVNGANSVTITSYTSTNATQGVLAYQINGVAQTAINLDNATDSGNAGVNNLRLGTSGLKLQVSGTDDFATKAAAFASVAAGSNKSYNFNYIKENQVSFQMKTGSGELLGIDADGTNSTVSNPSATTAYGTFNAAYNTGRGVAITFAAGPVAGTATFDYAVKNNYSVDVSTAAKASTYMTNVTTQLDTVTSALSSLGSLMARMTFKEDQVSNAQVNMEGAYSRIMNANMAEEQMNASKYSILQQTAVSMLAQANQAPQSLLSLFR